ncbi:hypothetical protein DIPPA_14287 [Diplonema papillatum]|nr:hypothetical protein DIPPA_14287 [Diplonema papillatum]
MNHVENWSNATPFPSLRLQKLSGNQLVRSVSIGSEQKKGRFVIGSSDTCDIVVVGPGVAARHAIVGSTWNGDIVLRPIAGYTGIYENNAVRDVTQTVALGNRTALFLGNMQLVVCWDEEGIDEIVQPPLVWNNTMLNSRGDAQVLKEAEAQSWKKQRWTASLAKKRISFSEHLVSYDAEPPVFRRSSGSLVDVAAAAAATASSLQVEQERESAQLLRQRKADDALLDAPRPKRVKRNVFVLQEPIPPPSCAGSMSNAFSAFPAFIVGYGTDAAHAILSDGR